MNKIQAVQFSKAVYTSDEIEILLPKIVDLRNYCEQHDIRPDFNDNRARKDTWVSAIIDHFRRFGLTGVKQRISEKTISGLVGKVFGFPENKNAIINIVEISRHPDFGKVSPGEVTPRPKRGHFESDAAYSKSLNEYEAECVRALEADKRYRMSLSWLIVGVNQLNNLPVQLFVRPEAPVYECLSKIEPLGELDGIALGDKFRELGGTQPYEVRALYRIDGVSEWVRLEYEENRVNTISTAVAKRTWVRYDDDLSNYPRQGENRVGNLVIQYNAKSPETLSARIAPLNQKFFMNMSVSVDRFKVSYSNPYISDVHFDKLQAIAQFYSEVVDLGDEYFLNLLEVEDAS
ncbi:MAG: hypothetical protein LRZ84_14610 [Desertifilum sp.]|nr:hypothetical protein [Desertifilum sp.]